MNVGDGEGGGGVAGVGTMLVGCVHCPDNPQPNIYRQTTASAQAAKTRTFVSM